jgi:thermitase
MKTTTLAALAVLLSAAPARAAPPSAATPPWGGPWVADEVLLKFRPVPPARRAAAVAAHGHTILRALARPGWVHVKVRARERVEEALAEYAGDPDVEHAQPNFVYRATLLPEDPLFQFQWGLRNTGQPVPTTYLESGGTLYATNNPGTAGSDLDVVPAWDHVTDCTSVVVAVLDTGIHYGQQDLAPNMWDGSANGFPLHGKDFVSGDDDPIDMNGHGTHVAGIIGASGNDRAGSTGVCWHARLMAVRVLDAAGYGTTATIADGVDFAIANRAKVMNMSFGGDLSASDDALFAEVLARARDSDAVVVVAAGNEGSNNDTSPVYPCSFAEPNLICVAALDQADQLATFSNFGSSSVDVGAPGTNIVSTWRGSTLRLTDSMRNQDWMRVPSGGSGWSYLSSGSMTYLVDPWSYPNGSYAPGADHRAYKSFATSAQDAIAKFSIAANVLGGDWIRFGGRAAGGDPFAQGGVVIAGFTDAATFPYLFKLEFDISACTSVTSSFGFQLESDAAGTDLGVAITGFEIWSLTASTTTYNTLRGTSMATPAVAGVAAMLRTYNPEYTAVDVVEAIKAAGRPVPALAGRTTSGRAVDAMATLAHIRPPSNVRATIH